MLNVYIFKPLCVIHFSVTILFNGSTELVVFSPQNTFIIIYKKISIKSYLNAFHLALISNQSRGDGGYLLKSFFKKLYCKYIKKN